MAKKFVRTERGERIDQPDFAHQAETSQRAVGNGIVDGFLVQPGNTYILDGFTASVIGTVVFVTNGRAILAARDGGVVTFGEMLHDGGPPTRSLDINSYANGSYTLYVRFEYIDDETQNRIFWNPTAVTPVEFPRNLPTRRTENWSIAIESASPGAEWTPLGVVTKSGATVTAGNTLTNYYFEGTETNNFIVQSGTEWGSANDRNSARHTYGVTNLRQFVRAVQWLLTDFRGQSVATDGWWRSVADVGAASLRSLQTNKLERNGSNTITGDITPDADDTRSFGSAVLRFFDINTNLLHLTQALFTATSDALTSRLYMPYNAGVTRTLLWESEASASPSGTRWRMYRATSGYRGDGAVTEIVANGVWSNGSALWTQENTGFDTIKAEFGRGGVCVLRKVAGTGPTWADSAVGWGSVLWQTNGANFQAANYQFAPALSRSTWVNGTEFTGGGDFSYGIGSAVETTGTGALVKGSASVSQAAANLHLPHGAVITAARAYFTTATPKAGLLAVALRRVPHAGTAAAESLRAGGTPYDAIPSASGSPFTQTLTIDESVAIRTVDNDNYYYQAWIYSDTASDQFTLMGFEVDYSMTDIRPT